MVAAKDAYARRQADGAVVWTCVSVVCLLVAALAFASLAAPSSLPAWASTPDGMAVMAVVDLLMALFVFAVMCRANGVLVRLRWHHDVDYAGSFAATICASIAMGATLARVIQLGPFTRTVPFAVFLAGAMCAMDAAYVQYAASNRMTIALSRFMIAAGGIVAVSVALTVEAGVPVSVVAAACSVGGAWYMHAQANVILRVPDRYLLEWRRYMTQKWTVRGAVPKESRPLRTGDIAEDMRIFGAEYTVGLVVSHLYMVGGYGVMCATLPADPDPFITGGFAAYSVLLPCYLLFKPRTAGSMLERMLMRSCASLIPLMGLIAASRQESWNWLVPYLVFAVIGVGVIVAATTLVVSTGFKSLMLSRIGDWLVASSVALMGPAAFLASNAMDMIRGFMS